MGRKAGLGACHCFPGWSVSLIGCFRGGREGGRKGKGGEDRGTVFADANGRMRVGWLGSGGSG